MVSAKDLRGEKVEELNAKLEVLRKEIYDLRSQKLDSKVIKESKKFYAHDEASAERNIGDEVTIEECRPLSKLKRWRVVTES